MSRKILVPVLRLACSATRKMTLPIAPAPALKANNGVKVFATATRKFATAAKAEPFLDPKDVTQRITEVVKNFEKVNAAKVSATARFKEDLDLDSLDAVELVMAIEEEFCIEIPDSEADKILSIADAINYVAAHPMAK